MADETKTHGSEKQYGQFHRRFFEANILNFAVWATIAILIGGIVEIVPMFLVKENVPTISSVKPYTPLEVLGRDIYIREGCVGCHSQMVRPFPHETERYGEFSKAGEFVYDHPFLWGSKRTGPDLARLGGKYPDEWHYKHMESPRAMVPKTNMPDYAWLRDYPLDPQMIQRETFGEGGFLASPL